MQKQIRDDGPGWLGCVPPHDLQRQRSERLGLRHVNETIPKSERLQRCDGIQEVVGFGIGERSGDEHEELWSSENGDAGVDIRWNRLSCRLSRSNRAWCSISRNTIIVSSPLFWPRDWCHRSPRLATHSVCHHANFLSPLSSLEQLEPSESSTSTTSSTLQTMANVRL